MKASNTALKFFSDFIFKELGIVYREGNYYQLENRLKEIAKQVDCTTVDELYQLAQNRMSPQLKLLLLDTATNNETFFFRDNHVFKEIENLIKESSDLASRNTPLKIWSAACSYGQEVYSLLMSLQNVQKYMPRSGYKVIATDISERALANAKAGTYTQLQIQRNLPTPLLIKYFDKVDPNVETDYGWKVKPVLQKNVSFKKLNLLDPFTGMNNFDIILCRNVLIYQTVESKKAILKKLYDSLAPGGFLIMGTAENTIGLSKDFESKRFNKAAFFQRPLPDKMKEIA